MTESKFDTINQPGQDDPFEAQMKKQGIEPNRENYIAMTGNAEEPWGPEQEDQLPPQHQDFSNFGENVE